MKEENNNLKSHILIIITVGIGLFLSNVDGSILFVAIPKLADLFHRGAGEVSGIILVYLITECSFSPTFGKLADIIGPEKVFTLGYIVFTLGSLLCAISPGLKFLIFFRLLQGFGGAMLLSTYCAVIAKYLPENIRGRAFGFVSLLAALGFAVGAPLGGILLKYMTWRWLFLVNIPFGILGIILALKILIKKTELKKELSFDLPGSILSFIWLSSLVYILNTGNTSGWLSKHIIIYSVISFIAFILFIIREKSCQYPLIDLTILKNFSLNFALLSALLVFINQVGLLFIFPFYFENIKLLATDTAGLLMMIFPLIIIFLSPVSGYLSDKNKPLHVAFISSICLALSSVLFYFFSPSTGLAFIIASFIIYGISLAMFLTSNVTVVMSYSTPEKEGVLSGLIALIGSLGAILGISLFEIIYTSKIFGKTIMEGYSNSVLFGISISFIASVFLFLIYFTDKKIKSKSEGK